MFEVEPHGWIKQGKWMQVNKSGEAKKKVCLLVIVFDGQNLMLRNSRFRKAPWRNYVLLRFSEICFHKGVVVLPDMIWMRQKTCHQSPKSLSDSTTHRRRGKGNCCKLGRICPSSKCNYRFPSKLGVSLSHLSTVHVCIWCQIKNQVCRSCNPLSQCQHYNFR